MSYYLGGVRLDKYFLRMRKIITIVLFFISLTTTSYAQHQISVEKMAKGWVLQVDGNPLMVNGINWDYFPIGTNYEYSLWRQSDEFIRRALDYEMGLLENAGINAIRAYSSIPKEWITYIYKNYGIYTMLNHSFGRYGISINEQWMANTDYSNPEVKSKLITEVQRLANEYKNTEGLLLYLLGNENNYGLFWEGAETEDIPVEDRSSTARARAMYQLFNQAIVAIKEIDENHPIAFCNGDVQFLEIITEEVPDADIFGTNTYRGASFTDLYERVANEYDKPVLLTEFGADAFNAVTQKEDQYHQAYYVLENWKEVYANAAGLNGWNNSIGGFTFQFSDGWWKYGQTRNLDVHDTNASWGNGGYEFDFVEGKRNMNEEWFGILAKGPVKEDGSFILRPRAAYYIIQKVHAFNPSAPQVVEEDLSQHFSSISLDEAVEKAKSEQ